MIPSWNLAGVLPPIRPGEPGHSPDRSPYRVPLHAFVAHFATSPDRVKILEGFLAFRARLHGLGIIAGFQWLDGSFIEQIEVVESRSPKDIDVVTYFHVPVGESQKTLFAKDPDIFDHAKAKAMFDVDSYWFSLGKEVNATHVKQISYWYSMWSHRRDGLWKGFAQVNLDPAEDAQAAPLLAAIAAGIPP